MTQKVVINTKHGGFGLTELAIEWMREQGCENAHDATLAGEYFPDGSGPRDAWRNDSYGRSIPRDDPHLIDAMNELGREDVSGYHALLSIVDIPDGVEWEIDEYDGAEWIAEQHRTWR